MTDIDLTPPRCLDVRFRPPPRPYRPRLNVKWKMPPPALSPTLKAIKRGHNTFGKLRKSLGRKHSDAEIRRALKSLVAAGAVQINGRTYKAGGAA